MFTFITSSSLWRTFFHDDAPESYAASGRVVWKIAIICAAVCILSALAYGAWDLWNVFSILEAEGQVSPSETVAADLDKAKLKAILQTARDRDARYQSGVASSTPADPSL